MLGYPIIMTNRRKSKSAPERRKGLQNIVRIIGGDWRGRKLGFPDADGLRPTGDRIRETVFNWLATEINGANVLDLFAGSGALGLEALSRGAAQATFIETNQLAYQALIHNIGLLKANNAQVHQQTATDFLLAAETPSFDLVFLDPPFEQNVHSEIISLLHEQQIITPGGYLYIESPADTIVHLPAGWSRYREKRSGQVEYMLCCCPQK